MEQKQLIIKDISNIIISEAEEKYVNQIQKLLTVFVFIYKSAIIDAIKKKKLSIIKIDNLVIGLIWLSSKLDSISYLIIDSNYRKKNLGTILFQKIIKEKNITYLHIKAINDSVNFWKKLGFIKTNKKFITKNKKILYEMIWYRILEEEMVYNI